MIGRGARVILGSRAEVSPGDEAIESDRVRPGLVGIEDLGGVWEWQDGCTASGGPTSAFDPCPAYGGRFTTAPAPERCSETLMLGRGDVSAIVGFRCCDE